MNFNSEAIVLLLLTQCCFRKFHNFCLLWLFCLVRDNWFTHYICIFLHPSALSL